MFVELTPLEDAMVQGFYAFYIRADSILAICEKNFGSVVTLNQINEDGVDYYYVRETPEEIIEKINKIYNPIE